MRLICLLLILTLAAGIYAYSKDVIQDRDQEVQIKVLQTKVDALQLMEVGRIRAPETGREKPTDKASIRY